MDNKVIEVFDYLGEKLGIAIDWTADNILPQVTEFMSRYTVYEIACSIAWIVISVITVVAVAFFLKSIYKSCKNKDGFWYYEDFGTALTVILSIAAIIIFIVVILFNIFEIIGWVTVPEMKFIETISYLMNSSS